MSYNISVERLCTDGITSTALAFIGDAVYALYVRKRIVTERTLAGGTLHLETSKYVNAIAQSSVFDHLVESGTLNPDEQDVAHRGKNAHVHSRTKAASVAQYHKATALEALIGYLELNGLTARRDEILQTCYDFTTERLNSSNSK